MADAVSRIKKAKKEDKLVYGYKRVLHALESDTLELVVVCANAETRKKEQLERRKGTIPVESVPLRNTEMGTLCKKPFPIAFIAIQKAF